MKYLGRLCLLCLQPDPKNRPNIDKIVLILKDSLSYLDRMYWNKLSLKRVIGFKKDFWLYIKIIFSFYICSINVKNIIT